MSYDSWKTSEPDPNPEELREGDPRRDTERAPSPPTRNLRLEGDPAYEAGQRDMKELLATIATVAGQHVGPNVGPNLTATITRDLAMRLFRDGWRKS